MMQHLLSSFRSNEVILTNERKFGSAKLKVKLFSLLLFAIRSKKKSWHMIGLNSIFICLDNCNQVNFNVTCLIDTFGLKPFFSGCEFKSKVFR